MHLFVVCQHIVIMVCIDTINLHYFNLYQFTKTWYHYDSEKSQWQDEETGTLVLTINTSSADRYTIKDKDDNKLVFDASGKLTKMQAPVVQLLKDPLVMLTSGSPWQQPVRTPGRNVAWCSSK